MQETSGIELLFGTIKKAELARAIGITPQAIGQWKHVPLERVFKISELTGIPISKLRPDKTWPGEARESSAI